MLLKGRKQVSIQGPKEDVDDQEEGEEEGEKVPRTEALPSQDSDPLDKEDEDQEEGKEEDEDGEDTKDQYERNQDQGPILNLRGKTKDEQGEKKAETHQKEEKESTAPQAPGLPDHPEGKEHSRKKQRNSGEKQWEVLTHVSSVISSPSVFHSETPGPSTAQPRNRSGRPPGKDSPAERGIFFDIESIGNPSNIIGTILMILP